MPSDTAKTTPAANARRTILLVVLTLAVGQLLMTNLSPWAPVRQGFDANTPIALQGARLLQQTNAVTRVTGRANIVIHFDRPGSVPPEADALAVAMYYGLNYVLFPARAYVGDGRAVINDEATMARADRVPSADWMAAHRVSATATFGLDQRGLHQPVIAPVR